MRNWQNIYSDPPYQRYCVKRDILVTGRNIPLFSCVKQHVLVFIAGMVEYTNLFLGIKITAHELSGNSDGSLASCARGWYTMFAGISISSGIYLKPFLLVQGRFCFV